MQIGVPELLIVLAVVIIVCGPSRIAAVSQALAESIRKFRQLLRDRTNAAAKKEHSS